MPECEKVFQSLPKYLDEYPDKDPEEFVEWDDCVPEVYDLNQLLIEKTRSTVVQADTAFNVVQFLTNNKDGTTSLPRIAVELLEEAAKQDPDIAGEFYISHVS